MSRGGGVYPILSYPLLPVLFYLVLAILTHHISSPYCFSMFLFHQILMIPLEPDHPQIFS